MGASTSSQQMAEANSVKTKTNTSRAESTHRQDILATVAVFVIVVAAGTSVGSRENSFNERPFRHPNIHSIAVLPLRNLSGNADQEYFADGFTEELVTDLAQIHSLKVISRTSIMIYKGSSKPLPQIARELNVDAILEGAVTRSGNRVRVTAQLIDAKSDTHIWAQTYDADLKDVLDIQNRVSRAIVEDVRAQLSPEEKARLASGSDRQSRSSGFVFAGEIRGGERDS